MKTWHWLPLAAILGFAAGSWGPRADLAALQEKSRAEHHRRSERRPEKSAGFETFAQMTGIPEKARQPRFAPAEPAATNAPDAAAESGTNAAPRVVVRGRRRLSPEDLRSRIEEAGELWRTRVELARTQWKGKLKLSGPAADGFDAALDEMNASMRESMAALASEIAAAGRMTPELTMRLMGEVTATMAQTYDRIAESAPGADRGDVSDLPVFEFIDPSVAEPLIAVQDLIEASVPEEK